MMTLSDTTAPSTGIDDADTTVTDSATIGPASSSSDDGSSSGSDGDSSDSGSSGSTGDPPMVDPGDVQALPLVRLRDVCLALDADGPQRCCLESACADDYESSVTCLTDRIQEAAIAASDEPEIDLLFVVDNTVDTGALQHTLALRAPQIVTDLQALATGGGEDLGADVNVMVTTTDFGNPLCTPFQAHPPEMGAPITTPCTDRLERFTSLSGAQMQPEVCTDVCPNEAGLTDGSGILHFDPGGDNVDDVNAVDIDGDGTDDNATSQALACLLPQGLNGCGYEQPLENGLQALNPAASWNTGGSPFLRADATLAVVVVTNEVDCSIMDYALMEDTDFYNTNPGTGMASPSSALCWNAGAECDGPDGSGVYDNCTPAEDNGLQPISRYTNYLVNELHDNQGKEVVMMVLGGVSANGVDQTVVHDWAEADLSPADAAAGVTAEDRQFDFGIGPACGGSTP
ncbi:MAG: hypothetical protein AAF721_26960 [Myxococcota bacterium]